MISAITPSIFSVDFSLSALMFPAGSMRMNKIFLYPQLNWGDHDYSATKEKRFQTLDVANGISVVLSLEESYSLRHITPLE